jgi:hypothetical protein
MRMSSLFHAEKLFWFSWSTTGHAKSSNQTPSVHYDESH